MAQSQAQLLWQLSQVRRRPRRLGYGGRSRQHNVETAIEDGKGGSMSQPYPVKTEHHLAKAMGEVDGFNAKLAVLITRLVGTMWCAYLFTAIALIGLGPALKPGGEGIIAWIAQTFLQLVLLSVIMVGQNVQSLAADARAENTFTDVRMILDRLDVHTQGGLKSILDRLDEVAPDGAKLEAQDGPQTPSPSPPPGG
jgi:hypothetical protein